MRVFLSWSGPRSKAVAESLREWLPLVVQALDPWMSDHDIKAGQQWAREIGSRLDAISFGIVCVTPENQSAPWLIFEAGALSKRSAEEEPRVAGYLLGLTPGQVEGPLSLFQHKEATQSGTLDLLKSLNSAVEKPLTESQLRSTFETWWPKLHEKLNGITTTTTPPPVARPLRTAEEMLEEIVETVRRIEKQQRPPSPPAGGRAVLVPSADTEAALSANLRGELTELSALRRSLEQQRSTIESRRVALLAEEAELRHREAPRGAAELEALGLKRAALRVEMEALTAGLDAVNGRLASIVARVARADQAPHDLSKNG